MNLIYKYGHSIYAFQQVTEEKNGLCGSMATKIFRLYEG